MAKNKVKELPQVLVLRRTYIQRFPNGQHVALYHSDALDQYITVPLDGSQFSNTTEQVMSQLYKISEENSIETITFLDESQLNINKECADIILNYIKENQEMVEQVSHSEEKFLELLSNAAQSITSDITEESDQPQELEQ